MPSTYPSGYAIIKPILSALLDSCNSVALHDSIVGAYIRVPILTVPVFAIPPIGISRGIERYSVRGNCSDVFVDEGIVEGDFTHVETLVIVSQRREIIPKVLASISAENSARNSIKERNSDLCIFQNMCSIVVVVVVNDVQNEGVTKRVGEDFVRNQDDGSIIGMVRLVARIVLIDRMRSQQGVTSL